MFWPAFGLVLWGFGLWWLALATAITLRYFHAGVPFNLGWWGYIFPLGVYTVATFRLGTALHLARATERVDPVMANAVSAVRILFHVSPRTPGSMPAVGCPVQDYR